MMIKFFHTPKPKQFKYRPRFYDPEREEMQELAKKYQSADALSVDDEQLNYYRKKVKSFDKKQSSKAVDFFRKKTNIKFNYQPRFEAVEGADPENAIKFKPMFEDEKTFAEKVPVTRIAITIVIIVLLLLWIFF